jgi:peptidoglycan hydrolase CwlO-like protein
MSSNQNAKSTIADLRARLNASEAELEQARSTIAELRAQIHQQQQHHMPSAAAASSTPSWEELADAALVAARKV